jgi:hypothetical protein
VKVKENWLVPERTKTVYSFVVMMIWKTTFEVAVKAWKPEQVRLVGVKSVVAAVVVVGIRGWKSTEGTTVAAVAEMEQEKADVATMGREVVYGRVWVGNPS